LRHRTRRPATPATAPIISVPGHLPRGSVADDLFQTVGGRHSGDVVSWLGRDTQMDGTARLSRRTIALAHIGTVLLAASWQADCVMREPVRTRGRTPWRCKRDDHRREVAGRRETSARAPRGARIYGDDAPRMLVGRAPRGGLLTASRQVRS
jgi:hypothetical protein